MTTQAITQWAISEFQKLSLWKWGRCKIFLVKMSFICMRMKKSFSYQKASHLASLWNRKLGATRKWHIFMITLKTARDGDRRTWQMTKSTFHLNFAWTFNTVQICIMESIVASGTQRWLKGSKVWERECDDFGHKNRGWSACGVSRWLLFSVSLSVWPRESEMRGKGVGTRLLLTVLCAQVRQGGYEEVQSESERRHGIFSKREYAFRILLLNQWLRYY